jgi:BTB/POZ domain
MASKPEMCLRWHSYENSLLMSVSDMWDAGVMTDITLSAEGRTIHAHQVVLSSSSDYFKEILQVVQHKSFHFRL